MDKAKCKDGRKELGFVIVDNINQVIAQSVEIFETTKVSIVVRSIIWQDCFCAWYFATCRHDPLEIDRC